MSAARDWIGGLPERYGRRTLIALALIAVLGLGVRAVAVVDPVDNPADDSRAYYALAKALYEEGSYGGPEFRDSSDWSPGAPLLYAGAFYATGGAREGTARIVEALLGIAAILVVFALGRRLAARWADRRRRLDRGPARRLRGRRLPALHPLDRGADERAAGDLHPARRGARLPLGERAGATVGLAPARPAVRADGDVPARVPAGRGRLRPARGDPGRDGARLEAGARRRALLVAAMALPIVPWTIRNPVVLDRTVPISTGGGKALYVGTYLPADGEYQRVKAILAERYLGRDLEPGSAALDAVDPTPLFDRVADRYPDLPRDSALGKIGKENLSDYFSEDPVGYAGDDRAQGRADVDAAGSAKR